MCKKLAFMCLALVLGVVSRCYADPVIGNWEGSTDGWFDSSKFQYSNAWRSLDSWSLKFTDVGYGQNLGVRSSESTNPNFIAEFLSNECITLDMHFIASEWADGSWAQIYELAIWGTGVSWKTYAMGASNESDIGNPTNPGHWDQSMGTYTTTISWNYAAERDAMVAAGLTSTNGYVDFIFATNCSTTGLYGSFYFDNARFTVIPEPATMVLLGLGSLALLRRKR